MTTDGRIALQVSLISLILIGQHFRDLEKIALASLVTKVLDLLFFTISDNSLKHPIWGSLGCICFFCNVQILFKWMNPRKAREFVPQLWIVFELDEAVERCVEKNYLQHPNLKMIIGNSHLSTWIKVVVNNNKCFYTEFIHITKHYPAIATFRPCHQNDFRRIFVRLSTEEN